MADIYKPTISYIDTGVQQTGQQSGGSSEVDDYINSLPAEERESALKRLTAPPSNKEIAEEALSSGRMPTMDEFKAIREYNKTKEVPVIETIANGFKGVMEELSAATGSAWNDPVHALKTAPANVVEGFGQGTRNLYGMIAESADPTSKLFRLKSVLTGSDSDEEQYRQFVDAWKFNKHSEDIMAGRETVVMDKDMIDPHIAQAMSYVLDPTLFIPFGEFASGGIKAVGMGEKLAQISMRTAAIRNGIIGGTLKWGVGAPIEFMGTAVRNTIDYGLERSAQAFETVSGVSAKEVSDTARMTAVNTVSASVAGHPVPFPIAGQVAGALVGSTTARGVGEAISVLGEQIQKQAGTGRGVLSYAGQALRDTEKQGIQLSAHAKGLLKIIDSVDPLFVFSADAAEGAAHGAMIGAGLGYLSGGEEGMYSGAGAGMALGGVGGAAGSMVGGMTNGKLYDRIAIQRKMVIEGLKTTDPMKAQALEAFVKAAEATGDRTYMAQVDGIIAGVDVLTPNAKFNIRSNAEHTAWLKSLKIDPKTGLLEEPSAILPQFGTDRKQRASAIGMLAQIGDRFSGKPEEFQTWVDSLPKDHATRQQYERLSPAVKDAVKDFIKNNIENEVASSRPSIEKLSDSNFDKWLRDTYEYFDPSNKENDLKIISERMDKISLSDIENNKQLADLYKELSDRYNHILEVRNQWKDWLTEARTRNPELAKRASDLGREIQGEQQKLQKAGKRQKAEIIRPSQDGEATSAKPKVKYKASYIKNLNYAEAHTARINALFDSGNPTQAKERINMLLKEETSGGKLSERGRLLKEKLATEGYFDKEGNMRPSRLKDVEMTAEAYKNAAGFVIRRDSTGQVEVNINLSQMGKETAPHELFHAIMLESAMKPEFIDRLQQQLIGKFDANGKMIEKPSVETSQVRKFFQKYIESKYRKDPIERDNQIKRLDASIKEYESRGTGKNVSGVETPLEHYVEEFGAYYFPNFIYDKPVDYLFRGGELGAIRETMQSVKHGWLDFWRSKIGSKNPDFNFDAVKGFKISEAFNKDGVRTKNASLDLFMQDFVRATSMANRNGTFDLSRLSPSAQRTFIENNGIRGYAKVDKDGRVVRLNRRQAVADEIRVGKEVFKVIAGLDPKLRQGLTIDGEGNFSGRVSPELADALVASGHVNRAWADKLLRAYDILDGKGGNVIEFGYLGRTAQIGDYSWPRLVGSDVPFKNRKAILLDVDFKVGKDGKMTALYHTLDHAVIEGRGNVLWSDPSIRTLWDGDRTAMEADFFRYLSNASLPSDHPDRVPSARLLEDGSGRGTMRRNALHQMLGMAKGSGEVYVNKPIAEIPLGIRHSVTTFNVDGISNMRISGNDRYDYNHQNAFRDLSRNWQPSEMTSEETPNGKIIKHATGYKITKTAGSNKFSVFDPEGKEVGRFDSLPDAGRAAQKHYNLTFDAKVEGKDVPVPHTETPPSRQAYIEKGSVKSIDKYFGNHVEKFRENLGVLIDRIVNGTKQDSVSKDVVNARLASIKESVSKGDVKISDLQYIIDRANYTIIDTSRLPYFDYNYFWERIGRVVEDSIGRNGAEYDAMYPMEIKSALHPMLAQIFQDYPNLTAKGLIGKIQKYGSLNKARLMQEATEIGLIDLLKSKPMATKIDKEIYRVYDKATESFTGEVRTREIPRQYEPFVNPQEILDFAKSKEIKVTIEEGAKEIHGMDTERLTLGGDKSNYKQTAIRINPEYAHGVEGHYGTDVIVHFRTTERLDAEGNKVLFIEEVQANNTDTKNQVSQAVLDRMNKDLQALKKYKEDAIDSGVFVESFNDNGDYIYENETEHWLRNGRGYSDTYNLVREVVRREISGSGYDMAMERDDITRAIMDEIESSALNHSLKDGESFIERIDDNLSYNDKQYEVFQKIKKEEGWKSFLESIDRRLKRDWNFFADKGTKLLSSDLHEAPYNAMSILNHQRVREHITDLRALIQKSSLKGKVHPMTDVKDWTLTAIKGVIRQAIRDGHDTITLTHPDDSPTVSHMEDTSRHPLYGKIIPELWGSWLKKYGIEIAQQNKLRDATLDTYRQHLVEVQNKIPEANKAVMDRFQQVMSGENSQNIIDLSDLLATPVHEITDAHLVRMVDRAQQINDVELRNRVNDLIRLKGTEFKRYEQIEKIRAEGVKGYLDADRSALGYGIYAPYNTSAEAIDRGMTFKLNDQIKRDFLDGRIQTHAQPTEKDPYSGGRTYDQNSKKWKNGFIGLYAATNPERTKGISLQFMKRADGSYRIRLTDTSRKGESADIGHITANISGDTATLSSHINEEYRGNKLSYVVYSEMAERLRAMGVTAVDGTIVNPHGIPIKVREQIIGDTRDLYSGRKINYIEGANRIVDKQAIVGSMGGVDVTNTLYRSGRYQPAEGEKAPVNWVKNDFYKEGYNSETIWMTPERFLKLASPLNLTDAEELSSMRSKVNKIKRTLQEKGSDMDMPYFQIKRNNDGELQVSGHEGRHRAIALMELYGDKKIPVQLAMTEALKLDNVGENDWSYGKGRATLKPESERKKGTVSRDFKALEETPFLNELGTGKFQPVEGKDWSTERAMTARENQPMKLWEYPVTENFIRWAGNLPLIKSLHSQTDANLISQGFVTTVYKGVRGRGFDTFKDRNTYGGIPRDSYGRDVTGRKDPNYFVSDLKSAQDYANVRVNMSDAVKKEMKEKKAYSFGNADMYYVRSENPAVLTDISKANHKVIADVREFWEKNIQDEFALDPVDDSDETPRNQHPTYNKLVEFNFDAFLKMVEEGRFLEANMDKYDMHFAIDKKYAEAEQLGHWNDHWLNLSKFLLEKGYDAVVVNDNTVSKNAPTIVIDQSSTNVKASSNYGDFSRNDVRFNFQPAENLIDWKSERTSVGQIIKNSAGYIISNMNGKWRVYNPYKAVVGIYDSEDKAKQAVIKKGSKQ